ncbi:hypothetical protein EMN47_02490 [Prolixibacteraceae bacterium JC049]|nr:hypothetical protein [Prolixibacteraceae bacterium JC049]
MITKDIKMADLIHMNHQLLVVLERFRIPLGFENKTITEICEKHNINLNFFLIIINAYNDENYLPEENLECCFVSDLIQYLKNSHRYYINEKFPFLRNMIEQFANESEDPKARLLINFFSEYFAEVKEHMEYEDRVVFPYIMELSKSSSSSQSEYNIRTYTDLHDHIEEKVIDLKSILIKYLPPTKAQSQRIQILFELFRLEEDLELHGKIEDKLLVPMVQKMENESLNR